MPDQPDDITRLRKSHYALDELPETVIVSEASERGTRGRCRWWMRPSTTSPSCDRRGGTGKLGSPRTGASALKRLHNLAREAGAIGTDRAAAAALKREKP